MRGTEKKVMGWKVWLCVSTIRGENETTENITFFMTAWTGGTRSTEEEGYGINMSQVHTRAHQNTWIKTEEHEHQQYFS